jgi:hypothetical protein
MALLFFAVRYAAGRASIPLLSELSINARGALDLRQTPW